MLAAGDGVLSGFLWRGGPDAALNVWVTQEQEDQSDRSSPRNSSCGSATQTLKAGSGPPGRRMTRRQLALGS